MPVIPATWEAETGEFLELGSGGCSELRSCTILQPEGLSETQKECILKTLKAQPMKGETAVKALWTVCHGVNVSPKIIC